MIDPSKAIIEHSARLEQGEVLSVAYLAGFPPADLHDCGPSVVVYAWTQAAADVAADALLKDIEAREAEFAQPLLQPDEAVQQAMRIAETAKRPVVIADTQDNPGAGGTGGRCRGACRTGDRGTGPSRCPRSAQGCGQEGCRRRPPNVDRRQDRLVPGQRRQGLVTSPGSSLHSGSPTTHVHGGLSWFASP